MAQFARGPQGRSIGPSYAATHAPHAALLIDFDNVTMGIRSDLTKELKNLLNSDIIKGKVAVQRAYADWRRYPQYIVPLSEASVDLIFAPAYGSSKKNATDIRLAIDALELVFTRPEIGTFILLSGDSDFSSLVLKLKEYGKYVIGVGIRESTSDLLVQNCDEYYSYSALTGLTRAGDEGPAIRQDPWEVVERAVQQMAEDGDVMRSDRLKQVMLQIDPNFDETDHGYSKFNKFVQDAAERGLISLKKLENGQYEVAPSAPGESNARREAASRAGERDRERERRRRRDAARDERVSAGIDLPEGRERAREERPAEEHPREERPREEPREERPREEHPRRERRPPRGAEPAEAVSEVVETSPVETVPPAENGRADLQAAYALLRRAIEDITEGRRGEAVRDSDVKRRMLEMQPGFDEANYGFGKFSRFLRQAHDAEIVNLQKGDNGSYEVELGGARMRLGDLPAPVEREEPREEHHRRGREERRPRGDRGDRERGERGERAERAERAERGGRGEPTERGDRAERGGQGDRAERAEHGERGDRPERPPHERAPEVAPVAERAPEAPAPQPAAPAAAAAIAASPTMAAAPAAPAAAAPRSGAIRLGLRTGSRPGRAAAGPPPILPGQVVGGVAAATSAAGPGAPPATAQAEAAPQEPPAAAIEHAEAAATAPASTAEMDAAAQAVRRRPRGGRGRGRRGRGEVTEAQTETEQPTEAAPAESMETAGAAAEAAPDTPEPDAGPEAPAQRPGRGVRGSRGRSVGARGRRATAGAGTDLAHELGLPTERQALVDYLVHGYKGVGQKTAESLVDALGASTLFTVLQNEPNKVRDLLGDRRARAILDAWSADFAARSAGRPAADTEQPGAAEPSEAVLAASPAAAETATVAAERPRRSRRGSRGGRGGRGGRRGGRPGPGGGAPE